MQNKNPTNGCSQTRPELTTSMDLIMEWEPVCSSPSTPNLCLILEVNAWKEYPVDQLSRTHSGWYLCMVKSYVKGKQVTDTCWSKYLVDVELNLFTPFARGACVHHPLRLLRAGGMRIRFLNLGLTPPLSILQSSFLQSLVLRIPFLRTLFLRIPFLRKNSTLLEHVHWLRYQKLEIWRSCREVEPLWPSIT
jgi:hypothetical protein